MEYHIRNILHIHIHWLSLVCARFSALVADNACNFIWCSHMDFPCSKNLLPSHFGARTWMNELCTRNCLMMLNKIHVQFVYCSWQIRPLANNAWTPRNQIESVFLFLFLFHWFYFSMNLFLAKHSQNVEKLKYVDEL